jgi:hypothetical protein
LLCKKDEDLSRAADLARNDKDALEVFLLNSRAAGSCKLLSGNTPVFIERNYVLGHPCVRPKGDPLCMFAFPAQLTQTSSR